LESWRDRVFRAVLSEFQTEFYEKKNETFKDFFRDFLIFFRFSRFFGFEKRNAMEISIFAFP